MVTSDDGKSVKTLIALARAKFRSDAALARALGTSAQAFNPMKLGQRAVSAETVAQLCDLAGIEGDAARQYLARSVADNPKNAGIRDRLLRVFFFGLGLGAVAWPLLIATPAPADMLNSGQLSAFDSVYIVPTVVFLLWTMKEPELLGLRLRRRSARLRPKPPYASYRGLGPSGCCR